MKIRDIKANEIEVRVGMTKASGVSLLLYKDARVDMAILDEMVTPFGWKREHSRDNANCIVSIWDSEKSQWVSKEDTGVESNQSKEKGLASDSFKRACFNWGIGRELYTSPFIWVTNCKIEETEERGRKVYKTNDKFEVSKIEIIEKNISQLEIINSKTKAVVFSTFSKPQIKKEPNMIPCAVCGKLMLPDFAEKSKAANSEYLCSKKCVTAHKGEQL